MIFSVVLATYNRKGSLGKCLKSLLYQAFPKGAFEVIVVDDGSNDSTSDFLRTLESPGVKFRFFRQNHKGPAAARNLGIKYAQGKIVAMTDDDCVPPLDWLEKLQDGFKRYPEVVGVTGFQEAPEGVLGKNLIAKFERYQTREVYGAKDQEVVGGWEVPSGVTNNVAFKKANLDEVGGFDENFPVPAGEDADLKKRITDWGYKLLYLPLKVEHHQEYSLRSFLRQQYVRGIGSWYFYKKWENRSFPNFSLLLKAFPRFIITWIKSDSLTIASLEFWGRVWMLAGEIRSVLKEWSLRAIIFNPRTARKDRV